MICRKCFHEWINEEIPLPNDIDCPNCGNPIFRGGKYVGLDYKATDIVKCRICGRTLTATLSVERGIGPRCWAALRRKEAEG